MNKSRKAADSPLPQRRDTAVLKVLVSLITGIAIGFTWRLIRDADNQNGSGGAHPPAAEALEEQAFKEYRHSYLRLTNQAPNRLTISTVMVGLTFAALAALLSAPIVQFNLHHGADWGLASLAISATLLGAATILFLAAAISTYAVLLRLGGLAPSTISALHDGTVSVIHPNDAERLDTAYRWYSLANGMIPLGLATLAVQVPIIAAHVNWLAGLATILLLALTLYLLRPLVQTKGQFELAQFFHTARTNLLGR